MPAAINIKGTRSNRLTALKSTTEKRGGSIVWKCACDCGGRTKLSGKQFRSGAVKSCGCLTAENAQVQVKLAHKANTKYELGSGTWLHSVWQGIRKRTTQSNRSDFSNYGARGITLFWRDDYPGFAAYVMALPNCPSMDVLAGRTKTLLTLDRVNNNKGYVPGNLRWATKKQQTRNRRVTLFVNKRTTLAEACEQQDLPYNLVFDRIHKLGWSVTRALTTPRQMRRV